MHWNIYTKFDLLAVPRPFPKKIDSEFVILIAIKSQQPDFIIRTKIRNTWMNSKNWDFLSIEHEGNDFQTDPSYRPPSWSLFIPPQLSLIIELINLAVSVVRSD